MKQLFILIALLLVATTVGAQTEKRIYTSSEKKAQEAQSEEGKLKREEEKRMQAILDSLDFVAAVRALETPDFVLEADRLTFKYGQTAFVTSNTNFISLQDDLAVVQISPFYSGGGPNGVGGITLEGHASNITLKTDKKGNVTYTMNVTGAGLSAAITIQMAKGSNNASVTVNPDFHSHRVTLTGRLLPTELSRVHKGRAF